MTVRNPVRNGVRNCVWNPVRCLVAFNADRHMVIRRMALQQLAVSWETKGHQRLREHVCIIRTVGREIMRRTILSSVKSRCLQSFMGNISSIIMMAI